MTETQIAGARAPEHQLPMIEVSRLTMRYGHRPPILRQASFRIAPGEFVFLTGPSGSGKTSLLRLLFRDLVPTEGTIVIAGHNLQRIKGAQLAHFRRQVGVVFQDFKLLPRRTVFQNVGFALRVTGASRRVIRSRVDQILPRVGLTHRRNGLPEKISGGEQQRVAIARAMVNNPLILLADEPTGNLDPRLSVDILDLFEGFNLRGTTVLIATHDTATALERRKRILRLEDGHIHEGLV